MLLWAVLAAGLFCAFAAWCCAAAGGADDTQPGPSHRPPDEDE